MGAEWKARGASESDDCEYSAVILFCMQAFSIFLLAFFDAPFPPAHATHRAYPEKRWEIASFALALNPSRFVHELFPLGGGSGYGDS